MTRWSPLPPGYLTRYRKALIQERTRDANRLHKVLEDAGIKLASVASDVLGVSGRAIVEALVSGTTDPTVLAELARGTLRKKLRPAPRDPGSRTAGVSRDSRTRSLSVRRDHGESF